MKKFERAVEPDFLAENAERWNGQWANLRGRKPSATFQWKKFPPTIGQPVNQLLLPILNAQTQHHCSYCDAFPAKKGDETIDHFEPKSQPAFFRKAFSWANLYRACDHCQTSKMEQTAPDLLRPDAPNYSFERFFVYNFSSHELEANPTATDAEKAAADVSIRIFGFNHPGQKIARRHSLERWLAKNEAEHGSEIDDFAYRFLFF